MLNMALATFGAGCFWCTEAVFQRVRGVVSVRSGYSGGQTPQPDYRSVCSGTTGHAECVQVEFNPDVVSYRELLDVFFKTHDPTTLNRQGADTGTQYRSVIFHHDEPQRAQAAEYIEQLNRELVFGRPVVTELAAAVEFFPAEDYHQNYFNENPGQPYCGYVIAPKLAKFQKEFADRLQ